MTSAEIDQQLEPVLRRMEENGVTLNVGYLETLAMDFRDQLNDLEMQIFDIVGHPFSLTSPKQLSVVLFEELGLGNDGTVRLHKRTTGFSTAASELEKFRAAHPVVELILHYRELGKLLSTYVEPLPQIVGPDGRLHTHYAPDAASGRLSSRKPNLQNIPTRTVLGKKIRQAFVAPKGYRLIAADYSQIQLRIMAHLANDETMLEVFRTGGDIHTTTSTALGIDRRTAKAVNFGIIYGLTAYGLSESLGVSREDAQNFIDGFFTTYPGVAVYMARLVQDATEQGYSTTLYDKRRPLPELQSHNDYLRKAAERVALNHPIQGTEAEIMKLAMIEIDRQLTGQTACRMILQVHDELVFEIEEQALPTYVPMIIDTMEHAVELTIPTPVEWKAGQNWAEMDALEIKKKQTRG